MVIGRIEFLLPNFRQVAAALEWLTTGLELALRTSDPESALEQLRPLRASCLSALGPRRTKSSSKRPAAKKGNTGER